MPKCTRFCANNGNTPGDIVNMTVDEYECIRLIDLLGMTQEECAKQMNVARTTVQAIYNKARTKLARHVVEDKELVISGGDYALCSDFSPNCDCGCKRQHCKRQDKIKGGKNE